MMTTSTTAQPGQHSPAPASSQRTVHPELEAYWIERKRYLKNIRRVPELRRRYVKAGMVYMLRRLLWSFGFFPLFLGFWIPFVVARFNPVAMVQDLLPPLQAFVLATPQDQAVTLETVAIAWLSVGFVFAVFDFVLTPFKSPYEYEAEVHMRAWEQVQAGRTLPDRRKPPAAPSSKPELRQARPEAGPAAAPRPVAGPVPDKV